MSRVDLSRLDGHWAVEEQRERLHLLVAEHPSQQPGDELGASYGEGGHENLPALLHGFLHDADELIDGFLEWTVVVIAVGGLQKHEVRLLKRFKIFQDERASRAEV